jgi:glycosyltransferase involved in cell wall biosynthesis
MPEKQVPVLIITYYWPPSGGAGVQRWLKFSKYLPAFGWTPFILTVDPEFAAYPVTDNSLTGELPSSVKVYKTKATDFFSIYKKDKTRIPSAGFANSLDKTFKGKLFRFIRGNFFIPDPRKGWNKYAFKKACILIETEGINHVITTSPPHSTQMVGLKLKKKYREINWIADLRDPWTDIYYYKQFYPTFISKWIDSGYEKSVLKNADRIITVGTSLKVLFSQKLKGIAEKTAVITNGYDEEDFTGVVSSIPQMPTISYIGTLSDAYPVMGFLEALQAFIKQVEAVKLRFIGTVSQNQKELITAKIDSSCLEFIDPVDHSSALRYMAESTSLLLIIPDHHSNKSIITGKIFEYIAAYKPVICLGPGEGDAAGFLNETGHGVTFSYFDSEGIFNYLKIVLKNNQVLSKISPEVFSRRELTGKVVTLLEKQLK